MARSTLAELRVQKKGVGGRLGRREGATIEAPRAEAACLFAASILRLGPPSPLRKLFHLAIHMKKTEEYTMGMHPLPP